MSLVYLWNREKAKVAKDTGVFKSSVKFKSLAEICLMAFYERQFGGLQARKQYDQCFIYKILSLVDM